MKSRKFIVSFVVLIVYMGIIFYLSSLPSDLLKPEKKFGFELDQSIKHFVEFSVLGILMGNVFWQLTKDRTFHSGFVTFASSSVFSVLYGISDEIHQYFVPTRYCTVFDMFIDAAGSLTGVLIFLVYAKARRLL